MNMPQSSPGDPRRREHFERVFAAAYEPLQRYVRRRGGGDDTDDIVAEALTVVWRRLDDVPDDTDGAAVAWCLGVARRCMANQRRSARRRANLVERLNAEKPQPVPGVESPDSDPELVVALSKLDEERREILQLWAWDELRPAEIAVVLGISANAASIRLHRARRDLAALLVPHGAGGHTGKTDAGSGHSPGEDVDKRTKR